MVEGNVCRKTSATAPLASSITLSRFCPEPSRSLSACPALRLQRKMLPELGIRADHLSKAGLKWLSNWQRIKLLSGLSFRLSLAALPSPCPFLFRRASLSDGQKELTCSAAWGRRLGSVKQSGKAPVRGEGGLNDGIYGGRKPAWGFGCWYLHQLKVEELKSMQRDRSRANLAQTIKHLVEPRKEPCAWEVLQQHRLEVLQEKQQDWRQLECNSRKEESRLTPRLGDAVQASRSLPSLPQNNQKKLSNEAHENLDTGVSTEKTRRNWDWQRQMWKSL